MPPSSVATGAAQMLHPRGWNIHPDTLAPNAVLAAKVLQDAVHFVHPLPRAAERNRFAYPEEIHVFKITAYASRLEHAYISGRHLLKKNWRKIDMGQSGDDEIVFFSRLKFLQRCFKDLGGVGNRLPVGLFLKPPFECLHKRFIQLDEVIGIAGL